MVQLADRPPAAPEGLDGVFGDTPRARARIRRLRVIDRIMASLITCGGLLIVLAVFGIFFFVGLEAFPLLLGAKGRPGGTIEEVTPRGVRPLAVGEGEYRETGWVLTDAGTIRLLDFQRGGVREEVALKGLGDARVIAGARAGTRDVLVAGTDDGRALVAGIRYRPVYEDGQRVAQEIRVDWQASLTIRGDGGPLELVAVAYDDERVTVAAAAAGFVGTGQAKLGGTRTRTGDASASLGGLRPTALTLDEAGDGLVVGCADGTILRYELERAEPALMERLSAGTAAVTALGHAFGSQTLLVGDADGHVSGWQGIRSDERTTRTLSRVRTFADMPAAVTALAPSRRNKSFLVIDRAGNVRLDHVTTERTLAMLGNTGAAGPIALAPRFDGAATVEPGGDLNRFTIDAPHPETTLAALFTPTLYENYDDPEFVWQTSGGTDDNEPKLSLIPLIFGSLKGVLYAMLFSAPLAIFAALFTSQFARPRMRGFVKPTVELMGALPSVVVGFLAGLWLSPMIDRHLQAFFNLIVFIPLGLAAAVLVFRALSAPGRQRFALGRELTFTLPFLAAAALGASFSAGPLESLLFDGDLRAWLTRELDVAYDRQNCFVVGIALGFAVMPVIFTVAEDALSNVPKSLRAASDALGASRWQTAWRLVLPAASPGIFAALMLGFGRAVGETMIVVMATGNTPILDPSPFNGMRTISAAIATEIPEAPVGGTLYRVLFLAGSLLFVFTFFANTAAEVIGERLRKRYARW